MANSEELCKEGKARTENWGFGWFHVLVENRHNNIIYHKCSIKASQHLTQHSFSAAITMSCKIRVSMSLV